MKKILPILFFGFLLQSCSKSDIQKTNDALKSADSLVQQAKDGYKTLDSITAIVSDSTKKPSEVILPTIEKGREILEKSVKEVKLDSLNKSIDKIKEQVKTGSELAKTVDSVSEKLQKGEVSTKDITETVNKILKNQSIEKKEHQPQNPVVIPPVYSENQESKSVQLNIKVEDLDTAKYLVKESIDNHSGVLLHENSSENEGLETALITIKIPQKHVEDFLAQVKQLGEVVYISNDGEFSNNPNQMCDVQIELMKKSEPKNGDLNIVNQEDEKPQTFGDKITTGFMKGFYVLGDVFLFLLPFWPLFLIVGLILFFVKRNRKKQQNPNEKSKQDQE